jgi:acetate kinase
VSASTILVVNAGSTSLKLRLLGPGDEQIATRDLTVEDPWEEGLATFLHEGRPPVAAGHRVVHGGPERSEPLPIDAGVEHALAELADLAPLHNPPAIRMIHALRELRPKLPAFACFDTSFHRTLPPAASTYALPSAWNERWALRRYGFHGLSHSYASRRAAELLGRELAELRLITAHLGAGASLAAVKGGESVDTTMGFTPLEGLVMATRSGSVDPGLLLWVQRHGGIDAEEAERALVHDAGLLGLSRRSGGVGELCAAAQEGDDRAALALEVYVHRLRAGIGAMAATLEGLDALVFTGGVGEGSAVIRERACDGLAFLGLAVDHDRNEAVPAASDADVSAAGVRSRALVVHAREDREIAALVRAALAGRI